jgi:glycosyltransferase involved in cell wall biosynthesis
MIVKNEENTLARCLDGVSAAVDEIIIADTGSTDRTTTAAVRYTDKIYDFPWINDFAAARNFAYSKAVMDYQLWLDADDVVPPEELDKLIKLKNTLSADTDMVTMKYVTAADESGRPIQTGVRERLTKTARRFLWEGEVHECIPLAAGTVHSDITIWHRPPEKEKPSSRNLEIYQAIESSGRPLFPRQQYYFANELREHGQFAKAAYYYERFLREGLGWAEDNISACRDLSDCYEKLGDTERLPEILIRSFLYGAPRAEICCRLGYYHMRRGEYKTALAWFQTAARLDTTDSLGFIMPDFWGFVPNLESCVCCCALGDYDKALYYNGLAGEIKPEHPAVLRNAELLRPLIPDGEERRQIRSGLMRLP